METHIEGSISRVAQLDPEVYKAAQAVVSRRMKRGKTWTPSSVDADVLGRHRIPHFAYLQNECIALDLLAKNGMHSIDQAMQRRARTYLAATTGGCIWPHRDFVIVAEPPISMELEGERTQRLHCATGAAMLWSDGAAIYASHGSAVDPDIIERVRTVAEIIALPSIEARRAAIERLGWAQYIAQANPPIVDVAPDPGNFPHVLELYDAPVEFQGMFRLLRMVNGSDERNAGDRRQFVELIPTSITSALAAAAWQFDCPVAEYAKVHRRT
ncbi:MAG TPA: hypothetical protein VFN67_35260 [Polyangiales bacterium]|nr:hypothetical protein [Polyangiales bacterium]